jgi:NAD(P)-dependent dehydrogenase (short-subunit alcohol dehydrogenase family)
MSGANAGSLQGKAIVIIGGTSGIGLSALRAFLAAGARVVAVGLKSDSTSEEIALLPPTARSMHADATESGTAPEAISECLAAFGRFDGLYHVAGGSGRRFGDGPLDAVSDEGWKATLDLNLNSVFYSNRAAVRQFLAQKSGGAILNVSSVLAWSPAPRYFSTHAYATAKAGIIGLTKSCAAYYAPQGIRFNVLAPGLVATPMSRRAQADQDILEHIRTRQPLDGGRIGQPQDLDAAAVFFLSDAAHFVTGQVLAVDGGWCVSESQPAGAKAKSQEQSRAQ